MAPDTRSQGGVIGASRAKKPRNVRPKSGISNITTGVLSSQGSGRGSNHGSSDYSPSGGIRERGFTGGLTNIYNMKDAKKAAKKLKDTSYSSQRVKRKSS